MRSRTSRGVPEWSGDENLYMGSPYSVAVSVRGYIGIVPGPPKGFRGSTGRVHLPQRALWAEYRGEPAPRWAGRQTPLGPMRLGLGGNPKGGAPLAWGASLPPLAAAPPLDPSGGGRPPLPCPINRGGIGGLQHHIQVPAPPLPNTSPPPRELGEALPENCHSTTTTPSCCCWSLLPQNLPPPC